MLFGLFYLHDRIYLHYTGSGIESQFASMEKHQALSVQIWHYQITRFLYSLQLYFSLRFSTYIRINTICTTCICIGIYRN